MKQFIYAVILVAVAVVMIATIATRNAQAQVPAGVTVDSVAVDSSWRCMDPQRAHHIVADLQSGKMVFIAGSAFLGTGTNVAPNDPVWMYSTNSGTTWTSTKGFLAEENAGGVCVAADSNFNVYIAYRQRFPSGKSRIFFNKDTVGDASGLGTSKVLSDTLTMPTATLPDIAVSKNGQHIVIIAGESHSDNDTTFAFVSHDGGLTFSSQVALSAVDPRITPVSGTPLNQWDTRSLSFGSNGYVFFTVTGRYDDSGDQPNQWWIISCESTDNGDTWTPEWVEPPPMDKYLITADAWTHQSAVALGTIPHICTRMRNAAYPSANDVEEMIEFHKEGAVWVWHNVSRYDSISTSYDVGEAGALGVDALGRLICVYIDDNKSVASNRQIFAAGSTDGGNTWTRPIRLSGTETAASGNHFLNNPNFPQSVPDIAVTLMNNGFSPTFGGGNPTTAWVQARFPLSAVWSGPFDQDTVARVMMPGGYIADESASHYNWYEVSGTGTLINDFHNTNGSANLDDGNSGPHAIGFGFPFYGHTYENFWISVNGTISFTDSVLVGFPFDEASGLTTELALFNMDLDVNPADGPANGHGGIYQWTNSTADTCVIEWHQPANWVASFDTTTMVEIILAKTDSSVTFVYNDVGNNASKANVGIQGGAYLGIVRTTPPVAGTGIQFKFAGTTAIKPNGNQVVKYRLDQNYPNPFNPIVQRFNTRFRKMHS